jgi:transcriptional antiterminator RfaH
MREIDGAVTRPECSYQIGQQIKIAGGPFDGLVATITALNDHDRLTVLMDLLNGRVKVQINALSSVAV